MLNLEPAVLYLLYNIAMLLYIILYFQIFKGIEWLTEKFWPSLLFHLFRTIFISKDFDSNQSHSFTLPLLDCSSGATEERKFVFAEIVFQS
jgi:hypothetical protein